MTNSNVDNVNLTKKKWWNRHKKISTRTGGGAKALLSKLSGAFLLPISVLAIAGLLLGIGSTIAGNAGGNEGLKIFGEFIKQLGDPLFGALPLLFAAALAVSFTEEAGVAVFNAIIGYLIFSSLQSVFIQDATYKDPFEPNSPAVTYKQLLFGGWGLDFKDLSSLFGTSLGIVSMQTSVFGGIIVGFLVQWAYNRFHTIQLPQFIAFFSGKRFVAFVVIALMIPLVFIFLLLWPYVGAGFNWFGENSGKIPFGFDSFIFGFIERSLVPFGLHHVFYSPLWYTSAGGDVGATLTTWLNQSGNTIRQSDLIELAKALKVDAATIEKITNLTPVWTNMSNNTAYVNLVGQVGMSVAGTVQGDSTTTVALVGVTTNTISFTTGGNAGTYSPQSMPLYDFVSSQLGIKLGRFLDGKFSFMPWGLPFAGLAMVLAAPKENRNIAIGVVFPASLTSFVTGVTEPIEFTFLFLAPALFFGFHAFMCALAFMLANLMNVHIGMTFSGGFLDLIIYGMIPVLKGTNFWWTIVVGLAYAPIYYFVFYTWIVKANLPTPGRGGNTKLFTKKDYQDAKNKSSNAEGIDSQTIKVIEAFGGKDNISKTGNCASRLRFDVIDSSLVSEEKLKQAGAFGVRKTSDKHVQAIFGPVAETLRIKIDHALSSKNFGELEKTLRSVESDEIENKQFDTFVPRPDLSENANEYLKFIDSFGGQSNISKITYANKIITFYLNKDIDLTKEYNVSLFNNSSITIKEREVKLSFDQDPEIIKRLLNQVNEEILSKNENIYSPVELGKLKPLSSLNDGVFSEKMLGEGFVVSQIDGKVYAPISGKIISALDTKHAYGIQAPNGLNVLVHIGIDTVKLEGKGFKSFVKQGDKVKQGDLLAEVDLNLLRKNNLISDVIVVVTPDSKVLPQNININDDGLIVSKKDVIVNKFK